MSLPATRNRLPATRPEAATCYFFTVIRNGAANGALGYNFYADFSPRRENEQSPIQPHIGINERTPT